MSRQNTSSDLGRAESNTSFLKQKTASFSTAAEANAVVDKYRSLIQRRSELQDIIRRLGTEWTAKSVDLSGVPEDLQEENRKKWVNSEQYDALCKELEKLIEEICAMKKSGGFSVQTALSFSASTRDEGSVVSFNDVAGEPLLSPKEALSDDSMASPPANRTGLGGHSCVFVSQASPGVSSQSGGRSPEISFVPPSMPSATM